MGRMQRIIGNDAAGGFLACLIASLIVLQSVVASVGFGMSGAGTGFVICSGGGIALSKAPADEGGQPRKVACPFCFLAAQSGVQHASVPPTPAPLGGPSCLVSISLGRPSHPDRAITAVFPHDGAARAPPILSV